MNGGRPGGLGGAGDARAPPNNAKMIHFCLIVMVGTLTDSNSGVAAFTFSFLACGNILLCSVFTLWPRGKLSDCSTKGGQPHRRRRNLKDPRPRCKKQCVAMSGNAGAAGEARRKRRGHRGRTFLAVATRRRSKATAKKVHPRCPRRCACDSKHDPRETTLA